MFKTWEGVRGRWVSQVDRRCMTMLQQLGNRIHPSIQLEVDYLSHHGDGRLPILGLKVWVERRMTKGGCGVCVLLHEFYSKIVGSKRVICARLALPWSSKRTILMLQVLRIQINCSRELPWETGAGTLTI